MIKSRNILGFLLLLVSLSSTAQNLLRVEDFTAAAGKEVSVPLYLDNADEVVGMQFDINLPYAKTSANPTLVTNRSNGHSVSIRKLSDRKYTVVVMSFGNNPLKGNAGMVLRFPIKVPDEAQADDQVNFGLENIVLSVKGGRNVATEQTSEAVFTVQRVPTPDFVVTDLQIQNSENTLTPGGDMQLQFTVTNQGTGESLAGWSEKIYFEDLTGKRFYLTTQTYSRTLSAGASEVRQYAVSIPQTVGTDGEVKVAVELVQNKGAGELIADQGNNEATSANQKTLERKLFMNKTRIELEEGKYQDITLIRSGDRSMEETFTLTVESGQSLPLQVPETVTIAAGQSGKSFRVQSIDNTEVNEAYRTTVVATGDDYISATLTVDVEDNDDYPLTFHLDKSIYEEGDNVTLTVTIAKAIEEDLKVNITNTMASRFYPYVRSITIPAGQLSASATTQVVDDNLPSVDASVTWTAQTSGYETERWTATLHDNDWPQLTLSLSRPIISEGDGYGAAMLTIERSGPTVENLTTYITHNGGLQLYFDSQYNIIPAGQQSVTIPVSVEDNSQVDGERTWTLAVAACDARTGRPVTAGHESYSTIPLTITDNDTDLALNIQSSTAQLTVGGSAVTLTLKRNTTAGDCVVNLSSESEFLKFSPTSVTIPSGSASANFTVRAESTSTIPDGTVASVVARANGYQSSSFVLTVSSLPDAVTAAPIIPEGKLYGGQTISVALPVTNQGTSPLEPGMTVHFYMGKSEQVTFNALGIPSLTELASYELTETIGVGETQTMNFDVTLPANQTFQPDAPYYLFAWLNYSRKFPEANTGNGLSVSTPVMIYPAFVMSSIQTDRTAYEQGATIQFSGQMSNAESQLPMEGQQVDIYMLDAQGQRRQVTTTLDSNGQFAASYKIPALLGGTFRAGACVSKIGTSETGVSFTVSALSFEGSYLIHDNLTESVPFEGDMKLMNNSPETLYNITFDWTGVPEGWDVEYPSSLPSLQAGAQTLVHYRIMPNSATSISRTGTPLTIGGGFTATGENNEGTIVATTTYPTYLGAKAATSKLVTDRKDNLINTTITRDGKRLFTLLVGNTGVKETGTITVNCSSGQQWLSATTSTLASLATGESTSLVLTLTGQEDMLADGTYEALVRLSPQNSDYLDVKVKATVVTTDLATLTVDVVDAYTLGAEEGEEGPHVSGATVRLTNNLTGEVAMTGTTGSDGTFRTESLKEGTYDIYVTAPNHYYAQKTMTVDPGKENEIQVFLNYEAVKMTYIVERTTVEDVYETVLSMDVVPDIPQAIVVPSLPSNWGVGRQTYSIRLTNRGRLTAYTPYLEFPNVEGFTFKVISDYPSLIYPNESYDVTVEYEGPEDARETTIGYIVMHYSYNLTDGMHQSSETYAVTIGKGSLVFWPSGGLGGVNGDAKDRNYGSYTPPRSYSGDGGIIPEGDDIGGASEPTIRVRDYSQSIDNRVRLQFKQTFLLEREAFRGTLTIDNEQMNAIEHITLIPNVKRLDGTDATDLFAINTNKDEEENWRLDAATSGEALVQYVPSKETAPTEPVNYLFGGTVTYRDVASGNLITVELTPTELSVNPSPDLHLMYFVQRDFISDDPTTENVVEPWQPTEFALLIQNKGAGSALNLTIEAEDPKIVENLNNLPVNFTKLYATVDGKEGNYNFNHLELGSIAPGQNVLARWWYYCNVSAYVANYEVQMTKASTYGEEFNLITLDGVRKLTHTVSGNVNTSSPMFAPARRSQQINTVNTNVVFLLNEIKDDENLPDYVIDQNGNGTDDLEIASQTATIEKGATEFQYTFSVEASRDGWVYAVLHDPTNCTQQLVRVIRQSDGADMTANFWQTNRTVQPDHTTVSDNRLHMADNINGTETYTLIYENPDRGDVNNDGNITIADVTALVNIILGKDNTEPYMYNHAAADVNLDGSISIADVTALVNIILGKE